MEYLLWEYPDILIDIESTLELLKMIEGYNQLADEEEDILLRGYCNSDQFSPY